MDKTCQSGHDLIDTEPECECEYIRTIFKVYLMAKLKAVAPIISIVRLLNDNYDGGQFMCRGNEIKLARGDSLLFPIWHCDVPSRSKRSNQLHKICYLSVGRFKNRLMIGRDTLIDSKAFANVQWFGYNKFIPLYNSHTAPTSPGWNKDIINDYAPIDILPLGHFYEDGTLGNTHSTHYTSSRTIQTHWYFGE